MRTYLQLSFLVAVSAIAAGCSAANDGASSASDVVIHPVGPGGDITLTVNVPPDAMTSSGGRAPTIFLDDSGHTQLTPNQATHARYEPDGNGFLHIMMMVYSPNGTLTSDTPVKITDADTVFTLGAFQISRAMPSFNPKAVIDVDHFQLAENLVRHDPATNQDEIAWDGNTTTANEDVAGPVLPAFPGHYTWTSNLLAQPMGFDVVAGAVAKVDANGSLPMASVLVQEEAKTFPDATPGTFAVWCTDMTTAQSAAQQASFGQTLEVYTVGSTSCTWGLDGFSSKAFLIAPKQDVVVPAKRLEIDDVELSDQPGTKVPGRYSVGVAGSEPVLTNLPTKTGVSLPVGTYHVHIDYKSPEGSPRTLDQDVTL